MTASGVLADEYFAALERSSRSDAVAVAARARSSGAGVADVARNVIAPAQRRVGDCWQRNEWTVADEHAATVISDIALTAIAGPGRPGEPVHGTVAAACVDGEWHAIALRIVAEGLREVGWDVVELGASLPAAQLASFLEARRPDAVLLSASLTGRLPAASDAVAAAAACDLPSVLGGAAVDRHPERAARIGAVPGETEVHRLHEQLVGLAARAPSPPAQGPSPAAERQAAEVEATGEQIVVRTRASAAPGGVPAAAEWTTVLDACIPELVASMTAAALLGDPSVLGEQLRWLHGVLDARGTPQGALERTLDVMQGLIDDLVPSASWLLAEAR